MCKSIILSLQQLMLWNAASSTITNISSGNDYDSNITRTEVESMEENSWMEENDSVVSLRAAPIVSNDDEINARHHT